MIVEPGSVDVTTYFKMRLITNGQAATVLTPGDFDLQYVRSGETAFAKADASLNGGGPAGAHLDNTVVEIDATDSRGVYRIDWPDAAFAVGVGEVLLTAQVTGTAFSETLRVELGAGGIDAKLDRNMDLFNHLRGFHTHQGNTYWVAPANGNDSTGDGTRALPYATLQNAIIDLVTSGNHDTVIVLADDAPGVTTHTSTTAIVCDKRYFSILGPGRDLIVTNNQNNVNTFEITADGIEISGFQIGTHDQGNGDGINITGADFHAVHDCWFLATQGDGIHCERGSNCQFHDNHFDGTGVAATGQGIHVTGTGAGTASDNIIHNNHFANTGGDSILIEQGTTEDTAIHHNEIHNAGGWGISIGNSSTDAMVHSNVMGNNASGNITDAGTTSIIINNDPWTRAVQEATIATLASQVSFTLSEGSADDDAYHGLTIVIANQADTTQVAHSLISAYTGATKTITLPIDPGVFTMAVGDRVTVSATSTASGIADKVVSTSEHDLPQSIGRRIRQATALVVANDTAELDNSPNANQIQLADGEPAVDGTFDPGIVGIIGGTGSGQCRLILEYEGSTRLATLNRDWKTEPDGTSEYIVMCTDGGLHVNEGLAQAGGASSITLNTLASSTPNAYNGQLVFLTSGLGQDQVGRVTAYNGTSKVATIETTTNGWAVQPDDTTGYIMIPVLDTLPTKFTGMTSVTEWLGAMAGKQAADATAQAEIRATGAGSGTFNETADSQEATGDVTEALTVASATKLAASAGTIVIGAAEAGTLSTTQMTTNLTESTDDHYAGRVILWTSGVLQNQATAVTAYLGATGMLTYTATTEAPSAADTFVIV